MEPKSQFFFSKINERENGNEKTLQIRALNDSEDEEVMLNIMSEVSKERESDSTTEANIADDRIRKHAETNPATDIQGKHDDVSIAS